MEKLKKCPFCGSEVMCEQGQESDGSCHWTAGWVICKNDSCWVSTPRLIIDGFYGRKTTKQDVINIWNNRVDG